MLDLEAAPEEVHVADAQPGELTPAQPAEREHPDQSAVPVRRTVLLTGADPVDDLRQIMHLRHSRRTVATRST